MQYAWWFLRRIADLVRVIWEKSSRICYSNQCLSTLFNPPLAPPPPSSVTLFSFTLSLSLRVLSNQMLYIVHNLLPHNLWTLCHWRALYDYTCNQCIRNVHGLVIFWYLADVNILLCFYIVQLFIFLLLFFFHNLRWWCYFPAPYHIHMSGKVYESQQFEKWNFLVQNFFFLNLFEMVFFLKNVFVAFVVPDTCYLLLLKHYYLQLSVIDNLFLIFRAFWHKLLDFLDSIYHIDWSTFWMVFTSYLFLLLFLE